MCPGPSQEVKTMGCTRAPWRPRLLCLLRTEQERHRLENPELCAPVCMRAGARMLSSLLWLAVLSACRAERSRRDSEWGQAGLGIAAIDCVDTMCQALCWGFADTVPFKPHSSFNQETLTKQLPGITVGDRQTRIMKMVKTTKSQFPTKGTFCVGRYTDSN